MPKHWAVTSGSKRKPHVEYIHGDDADSAEAAEKEWRRIHRLYFMPVTVRRTTDDEDRQLESVEKEAH